MPHLPSWLQSLKAYLPALGIAGWAVYLGFFGTLVGASSDFWGWQVPGWLWVPLLVLTSLIAPFIAFHQMRVALVAAGDKAEGDRQQAIVDRDNSAKGWQD